MPAGGSGDCRRLLASIRASRSRPARAGWSRPTTARWRRLPTCCATTARRSPRSSATRGRALPARRVQPARLQLPDDRPAGGGRARAARASSIAFIAERRPLGRVVHASSSRPAWLRMPQRARRRHARLAGLRHLCRSGDGADAAQRHHGAACSAAGIATRPGTHAVHMLGLLPRAVRAGRRTTFPARATATQHDGDPAAQPDDGGRLPTTWSTRLRERRASHVRHRRI